MQHTLHMWGSEAADITNLLEKNGLREETGCRIYDKSTPPRQFQAECFLPKKLSVLQLGGQKHSSMKPICYRVR